MRSSWNLGKTQTIRVPVLLKDYLLEIARHIDEGGRVEFIKEGSSLENSKTIVSQGILEKAIAVLRHGITSKKQGGIYNSSNASTLKKEVIKALEILGDIEIDV